MLVKKTFFLGALYSIASMCSVNTMELIENCAEIEVFGLEQNFEKNFEKQAEEGKIFALSISHTNDKNHQNCFKCVTHLIHLQSLKKDGPYFTEYKTLVTKDLIRRKSFELYDELCEPIQMLLLEDSSLLLERTYVYQMKKNTSAIFIEFNKNIKSEYIYGVFNNFFQNQAKKQTILTFTWLGSFTNDQLDKINIQKSPTKQEIKDAKEALAWTIKDRNNSYYHYYCHIL